MNVYVNESYEDEGFVQEYAPGSKASTRAGNIYVGGTQGAAVSR